MCRSQTGHEVRNTRTRGCNRHPGLAGHASDAPGDKSCILFVPADYRLNGGVAQGIEYFVNLCARHSKNIFRTLGLEYFDDDIRTCLRLFRYFCFHPTCSFWVNYSAFSSTSVVSMARFSCKNVPDSGSWTS